ncbi:galactinol synthase [Kwoniella heveanensis BCC8398]|uniref:Galactinol synthase n=1 Tax=Kwoniella heveanensis BCC8398 TaxID=1296120 RepID=A0A1B9GQN0_9TREE|nr:galactinol synthase [Kwoniella heveanensis BCC8398]
MALTADIDEPPHAAAASTESASGLGFGLEPELEDVRKAWITLITNEAYVAGLLTLHRTLVSLSSYPLIAMTTSSLSSASQDLITSASIPVIQVDHLTPSQGQHGGFDPSFSRFDDAWTKLQVFGLEQFETLILIDSDMIFLKEMDELFEYELPARDWVGAAPACVCNPLKLAHYPKDWIPANCAYRHQTPYTALSEPPIPSTAPDSPRTSHLLNSGLVILHPSKTTLQQIVHHLNTSPTIAKVQFADQDVMAEVFRARWKPLPWWCNALKTLRAVHQDVWRDEEVRLIHYILDKPWHRRPAHLAPHVSITDLPPTPITASNGPLGRHFGDESDKPIRRPLPAGLLDAVRSTDKSQESLTDYQDVHGWWWIVYEDLLDDYKAVGDERWKLIDRHVKR